MHDNIWNGPPLNCGDTSFYRHPFIVSQFQSAMREFRKEVLSQDEPQDLWEPGTRGIVVAGGGERYFPSLYIHLKMLRLLNCQLPVEVWYLGPMEMDPIMESMLREPPISATVIDAREIEKKHPARILNGWELKPYSTYYSSFEEVLFLDADNLAVRSPCYLFEYPDYRSKGAIFWPDYAHFQLKPDVWEIFDMPGMAKVFHQERAFESGQYLINKHLCHRELRFALWLAERSDFVFKHVYGDKECFHLAWRYLGTEYVMPRRGPGWLVHTIIQYDLNDQVIFQHRCRGKWMRDNNRRVDSLKHESECFSILEELKRKWSWKLWFNPNKGDREKAIIQELTSKTWTYERVGYDKRPMRFCNLGMVTLGRAGREHMYDVFVTVDKVLVPIFGEDGKLTMVLRRENENRYVGQWLEYERMPIVLQAADDSWNSIHKADYHW